MTQQVKTFEELTKEERDEYWREFRLLFDMQLIQRTQENDRNRDRQPRIT